MDEKQFECPFCKTSMTRFDLVRHMYECNMKQYAREMEEDVSEKKKQLTALYGQIMEHLQGAEAQLKSFNEIKSTIPKSNYLGMSNKIIEAATQLIKLCKEKNEPVSTAKNMRNVKAINSLSELDNVLAALYEDLLRAGCVEKEKR